MSTDAITVLKNDHTQVRRLFREFERAVDDSPRVRWRLVNQILEMLTMHTHIENEAMYPRVRALLPDLEADVLESYEEHHLADLLCMELDTMTPTDERFYAKVTVLIETVRHHMDEEEQDWFPKVRIGLGRKQLADIGATMLDMKKTAPRRPEQPGALKKAAAALIS